MPHDAIMKMRMDLERKSNAEDRDSKFGPVDPSVPSIPRPWIQIPTEHLCSAFSVHMFSLIVSIFVIEL